MPMRYSLYAARKLGEYGAPFLHCLRSETGPGSVVGPDASSGLRAIDCWNAARAPTQSPALAAFSPFSYTPIQDCALATAPTRARRTTKKILLFVIYLLPSL